MQACVNPYVTFGASATNWRKLRPFRGRSLIFFSSITVPTVALSVVRVAASGADLDGLRGLSNRKCDVHPGRLLHLNLDRAGRGLKAWSAHLYLISGRNQIRKTIDPGIVAGQ